jgi:uncharacterized protein with NRDE domain
MCVIFIAYMQRADCPLILLANRDEFYDRPTLAAARWDDFRQITAGRDLIAGGTWLGVTDSGRFAAVTNYRDPGAPEGILSRGGLVADFLKTNDASEEYLDRVRETSEKYSGFNLITGEISEERNELFYYSNRDGGGARKLGPGVHGLSNHLLNTGWPKVASGSARFSQLIEQPKISTAECFQILSDENLAADADLPDTGIGLDRERILSPIFIRTPTYGTRCSTVLTFDKDLKWDFEERTFVC